MSRRTGWCLLPVLAALPAAAVGQAPDRCATAPVSAEQFAPALADSGQLFRAAFGPDGTTLYYFKKVAPRGEEYRIFVSRREGASWAPGAQLQLGTVASDLYPSVSPDGRRLVFASYRPAPGDPTTHANAYLWYADRQGTGWGPPVFIAAASLFGNYHSGPVIDSAYTIQFHRTAADWRTTWDMTTRWDGRRYLDAEPVRQDDPRGRWRHFSPGRHYVWGGLLAPSGAFAVLDVSPLDSITGRRGPPEVWLTRRMGGEWSLPYRAGGGINSAASENFVTLTPDGCGLVFTRDFSRFMHVGVAAALGADRP